MPTNPRPLDPVPTALPATDLVLVDDEVARRCESALAADVAAFVAGLARSPEDDPSAPAARAVPLAGGLVAFTGRGLFANRAQGVGLGAPLEAADLDRIEAFLSGAGVPIELEVCPHADASVVRLLSARDYRVRGFRNVYVRSLGGLPGADTSRPAARSPGIAVHVVDEDTFPLWNDTLLDGFGYEHPNDRARVTRWNRMLLDSPQILLFLARIEGRPVGAASLVLHPDAGSLGGMATRPRWRGRGVQAALLAARLRAVADRGGGLAVVTADPGSQSARNVQRAGFQLAYTNTRLVAR